MYTAIYMAESGNIEEKKFETLEESRAFFKELAKKNIPIKTPKAEVNLKKMRIDEVNDLLSRACSDAKIHEELLKCTEHKNFNEVIAIIRNRIALEIEKHDLLLKR